MRRLTPADVAHRPAPGTTAPTSIRFAPDGSIVTWLAAEPGSLRQELIAIDLETGDRRTIPAPGAGVDEDALSIEERLRRERARELAVGITRCAWAQAANVLLVPMQDGLWIYDDWTRGGEEAPPRRVLSTEDLGGPVLDAAISADGSTIGFVAHDEVHVVDVASGEVRAVTSGAAAAGVTHGLAEYIAQEEMGRATGFWLSPDGSHVAFCQVDDAHIPVYRIVHQGSDEVGPGAEEDHRYPFAGADNAVVRLGIVGTDRTTDEADVDWLDLGATGIGDDRYLARVAWAGDDAVLVQVEDRAQQRLDLIRYERADGTPTLLLTETSTVWLNLHDHLRVRPDGSFLWASETSGYQHLSLHDAQGARQVALTSGDWAVTAVNELTDDEVWFTATADSPLERHLYRTALDGSGTPTKVTTETGVHQVVVSAAAGRWVDVHTDRSTPPVTSLRDLDDPAAGRELARADADPSLADLDLRPPTVRTITADDGTILHGAIYEPDGPGPHPTVIWVYGGPHAQLVTDSWALTAQLRAQYLRQEGFCVAVVDNRGSANRGLAFEGALRWRMGTVEVDDQVAWVESLVDAGLTDPGRVGIVGWSYGGYMAAMCLARRPDVFAAACAGAPVTHWDGYDTHYTERYMGTPEENPDGYRDGSVMAHIEGLRDRDLLLVHGLIDENVHFRHTARLIDALVRADIDHRLLLYPRERHTPRNPADRASMERQIAEFFRRALASVS